MAKKEEIFDVKDESGVGQGLPNGDTPAPKVEETKKETKEKEAPPAVDAGGPPDTTEGLPDDDEEIFEEDFTGVEEGGFPFIPKGFYHAKVQDMEKGMSQAGNAQYTWKFKIIAGPPDVRGVTLRFWTSLLPQSRWKVVETLEALGVKASGSIARFRKKDVCGKPCIIQVIEERYEGQPSSKIQKVFKPSEKTLEAVENLKEDIPF